MTDVGIIIVTWNSRADLLRCLPSLGAGAQRCSVDVVVVDNASSDDTVAVARSLHPSVTLLENPQNEGFAAANNRALGRIGARYALLLNADTELRPGALDALVGFMDTHPGAWACGPAMLNGDGSPQRTGVHFPTIWNLLVEALFLDRLFPQSRLFGRHRALYEDPARVREVDYVQGSCLLMRSSAIDIVGRLDESYFVYFEETDWCFRAKKAGGKIFLVPSSEVVHYGGGEEGHYDAHRLVHYHRGLLRFYRKHHALLSRCLLRPVLALRSLLRLVVWAGIALTGPARRTSALSSVRGYVRVLQTLLQKT